MGEIILIVPGLPIAQPRHRATSIGGHARMYLPKSAPVNTYKAAIQLAWKEAGSLRLEGAVRGELEFVFARPKAKTKKRGSNPSYPHTGKPDLDNLYKAVMDALNGLAFHDDSQVSCCHVMKRVGSPEETPYTRIVLRGSIE